jgi:hypothetical protein
LMYVYAVIAVIPCTVFTATIVSVAPSFHGAGRFRLGHDS